MREERHQLAQPLDAIGQVGIADGSRCDLVDPPSEVIEPRLELGIAGWPVGQLRQSRVQLGDLGCGDSGLVRSCFLLQRQFQSLDRRCQPCELRRGGGRGHVSVVARVPDGELKVIELRAEVGQCFGGRIGTSQRCLDRLGELSQLRLERVCVDR